MAADGLVQAVATADGRVEVAISPRAMRLDSQTLGEQVTVAVNAALDHIRQESAQTAGTAAPDSAALIERLQEVQHASVARMETFLTAITEAHLRITQRKG